MSRQIPRLDWPCPAPPVGLWIGSGSDSSLRDQTAGTRDPDNHVVVLVWISEPGSG